MALKIICLVAVFCGVQALQDSSLQKRDLFQDAINLAMQPLLQIQQQINNAVTEAQKFIDEIHKQIVNIVASVLTDLQAKADQIVAQVFNIPTCAIGQAGEVGNVVTQAGLNVASCANATIAPVISKLADALSLVSQVAQLVQNTPSILSSGSIFDIPLNAAAAVSKATMLASSITGDLLNLSTQLPNVLIQIPACGVAQFVTATQKLEAILTNVKTCIQNAPVSG